MNVTDRMHIEVRWLAPGWSWRIVMDRDETHSEPVKYGWTHGTRDAAIAAAESTLAAWREVETAPTLWERIK